MNRGDVVLARFPHPSGGRGKKRPVVVVQADIYNQGLRTLVVAEVTKNLSMANDPAWLFIDASTPDGQATGLVQNSVVSCLLMATLKADLADQIIGALSHAMKQKLNACLKTALDLPWTRVGYFSVNPPSEDTSRPLRERRWLDGASSLASFIPPLT